jgi:hypothetical protein
MRENRSSLIFFQRSQCIVLVFSFPISNKNIVKYLTLEIHQEFGFKRVGVSEFGVRDVEVGRAIVTVIV